MSNTRLIFSNNAWVEVNLPSTLDPTWTDGDTYYYSMVWALAVSKGFEKRKADILAECATYKRVCPGITFDSRTEFEIGLLEN